MPEKRYSSPASHAHLYPSNALRVNVPVLIEQITGGAKGFHRPGGAGPPHAFRPCANQIVMSQHHRRGSADGGTPAAASLLGLEHVDE